MNECGLIKEREGFKYLFVQERRGKKAGRRTGQKNISVIKDSEGGNRSNPGQVNFVNIHLYT